MPVVDQRAKRSDGHDQDQRAAHDQAFRKQLHPRCRHDKWDEPKRIEDQRDHDGEHRRAQTAAPAHDAPDFLLRLILFFTKSVLAQDIRGFALRHLQLKLIDFFMDVFKLKFIEIDRTPVLIRASIEYAFAAGFPRCLFQGPARLFQVFLQIFIDFFTAFFPQPLIELWAVLHERESLFRYRQAAGRLIVHLDIDLIADLWHFLCGVLLPHAVKKFPGALQAQLDGLQAAVILAESSKFVLFIQFDDQIIQLIRLQIAGWNLIERQRMDAHGQLHARIGRHDIVVPEQIHLEETAVGRIITAIPEFWIDRILIAYAAHLLDVLTLLRHRQQQDLIRIGKAAFLTLMLIGRIDAGDHMSFFLMESDLRRDVAEHLGTAHIIQGLHASVGIKWVASPDGIFIAYQQDPPFVLFLHLFLQLRQRVRHAVALAVPVNHADLFFPRGLIEGQIVFQQRF